MLNKGAWIDKANEKIDISDVLSSLGIFVPPGNYTNTKKIHCPFGLYHSDGGTSKAMRMYSHNNTVYCFSCSKRYSPVSLAAAAWDCPWFTAAMRLLEDAGFKPKTLTERWADATTPDPETVDLIALADALKMFCSGICNDWSRLQYNQTVAKKLSRCLDLVSYVKTANDADKWLSTCQLVMSRCLQDVQMLDSASSTT